MAESKLVKLQDAGKSKYEISKAFFEWAPPKEVWDWLAEELSYKPGWAYYRHKEAAEAWQEKEADKEREKRAQMLADEARMKDIAVGRPVTQWLKYGEEEAREVVSPEASSSAFVGRKRR